MAKTQQTPEEIEREQSLLTDDDVYRVMMTLRTVLPADKDLVAFTARMVRESVPPAKQIENLLGTALDWFKYGN